MSFLRILFAAVAAIAAWLVTHMVVEKLLSLTAILFCPEGFGDGGQCYVDWWTNVSSTFIVVGVGLSATATIIAAVWVANSQKQTVSRVTFVIGMIAASGLVFTPWLDGLVVACWLSALLSGWLTVKRLEQ